MPISINTMISAMDTPSSLLPFFVKDAFDVTGRTLMANNTGGKHEAREKFIEEAGTSLFWIGGIPAARWIANQLYKDKIDSQIHFKRINQDGVQNYFAKEIKEADKFKYSKQDLEGIEFGGKKFQAIKNKLKDSGYVVNGKKGFYSKFHIGATTAAVIGNLVVLSVVLPQLNLLLSRKLISKETKQQKKEQEFRANLEQQQQKDSEKKQTANPSFGSIKDFFKVKELFNFASMAEKTQLEPVSGMLLLDYGISGSRVTITPRNSNERIENAIKEGGIIFFFYYAAELIKNGLAKVAQKHLKTPIDLDYKVLSSKDFVSTMKNAKKEDIVSFNTIKEADDKANEVTVIKMIDKELAQTTQKTPENKVFKNFTLQMAQQEGLIKIEYDDSLGKWIRHSKKYIETEKIINLNNNLATFYENAAGQAKKASRVLDFDKVIAKTKQVKIASIFANMAICCASLSYIVPKIQYLIREHRTQTKSAPGILHYQEMAMNNKI